MPFASALLHSRKWLFIADTAAMWYTIFTCFAYPLNLSTPMHLHVDLLTRQLAHGPSMAATALYMWRSNVSIAIVH